MPASDNESHFPLPFLQLSAWSLRGLRSFCARCGKEYVRRETFDPQVSETGIGTPSAAKWPEHTSSLAKTCKKIAIIQFNRVVSMCRMSLSGKKLLCWGIKREIIINVSSTVGKPLQANLTMTSACPSFRGCQRNHSFQISLLVVIHSQTAWEYWSGCHVLLASTQLQWLFPGTVAVLLGC